MDEQASDTPLAEQTFPITVDLKLRADNQVYIRGAGLDVEMAADVDVRRPPVGPVIDWRGDSRARRI